MHVICLFSYLIYLITRIYGQIYGTKTRERMVERWFGKVKKLAFLRTTVEEKTFEHTTSFFFLHIKLVLRFLCALQWSHVFIYWSFGQTGEEGSVLNLMMASYGIVGPNRTLTSNFLMHACTKPQYTSSLPTWVATCHAVSYTCTNWNTWSCVFPLLCCIHTALQDFKHTWRIGMTRLVHGVLLDFVLGYRVKRPGQSGRVRISHGGPLVRERGCDRVGDGIYCSSVTILTK